jgi:hypothetical protein
MQCVEQERRRTPIAARAQWLISHHPMQRNQKSNVIDGNKETTSLQVPLRARRGEVEGAATIEPPDEPV